MKLDHCARKSIAIAVRNGTLRWKPGSLTCCFRLLACEILSPRVQSLAFLRCSVRDLDVRLEYFAVVSHGKDDAHLLSLCELSSSLANAVAIADVRNTETLESGSPTD